MMPIRRLDGLIDDMRDGKWVVAARDSAPDTPRFVYRFDLDERGVEVLMFHITGTQPTCWGREGGQLRRQVEEGWVTRSVIVSGRHGRDARRKIL